MRDLVRFCRGTSPLLALVAGLLFPALAPAAKPSGTKPAAAVEKLEVIEIEPANPKDKSRPQQEPEQARLVLKVQPQLYIYVIRQHGFHHKTLWPRQMELRRAPASPLKGERVRIPVDERPPLMLPRLAPGDVLCVRGSPTPLAWVEQICEEEKDARRGTQYNVQPTMMVTAHSPDWTLRKLPPLSLAWDWQRPAAEQTPGATPDLSQLAPAQAKAAIACVEGTAPAGCPGALTAIEQSYGPEDSRIAPLIFAMVERTESPLFSGQKPYYEYRQQTLERGLHLVEKYRGAEDPLVVDVLERLAESHYLASSRSSSRRKAAGIYQRLYAMKKKSPERANLADLHRYTSLLAEIHLELDDFEQAAVYLKDRPSSFGSPQAQFQEELSAWQEDMRMRWRQLGPENAEQTIREALGRYGQTEGDAQQREERLLAAYTVLFGNLVRDNRMADAVGELDRFKSSLPEPRSVRAATTLTLMQALLEVKRNNVADASSHALDALRDHGAELGTCCLDLRAALRLVAAIPAHQSGSWMIERDLLELAISDMEGGGELWGRPKRMSWVFDLLPEASARPKLSLAEILVRRRQIDRAVDHLGDEILRASRELVGVYDPAQSQQIKRNHKRLEQLVYSLALAYPNNDDALNNAMALALSHQSIGTEQRQRAMHLLRSFYTGKGRPQFDRLLSRIEAREHLLWMGPASKQEASQYGRELDKLKLEATQEETRLLLQIPQLKRYYDDSRMVPQHLTGMVEDVAGVLDQRDAALFVVVKTGFPDPQTGQHEERESEQHYVGMLLTPDEQIRIKDLGHAREIDVAVEGFRSAIMPPDQIGTPPDEGKLKTRAYLLYKILLEPFASALGTSDSTEHIQRVFLALDGSLQMLPFAALYNGKEYLIDLQKFVYLTAGRDLLRIDLEHAAQSGPAVFANPSTGRAAPPGAGLLSWINAPEMLPSAEQDARTLTDTYQGVTKLQTSATEAAVRELRAPVILHIASHGVFLPGRSPTASPNAESPGETCRRIAEPLSRSAIFLAGSFASPRSSGEKDGILTAEEAQWLNLRGTKLVVLSACQTGQGEVTDGEGVAGMRRAFLLAGAETLMASLWVVSNEATRQLMKAFYKALTAQEDEATDRVAALSTAMAALRNSGLTHPYYWASFILIGQDGAFKRDHLVRRAKTPPERAAAKPAAPPQVSPPAHP